MKPPITPTPSCTAADKQAYAAKYFKHEYGPERRSVGMALKTGLYVKEVVNLIAHNTTSLRSYVGAILREHMEDYSALHGYFRRRLYNQVEPGDASIFEPAMEKYVDIFLNPANRVDAGMWISVDKDIVKAMASLVKWLDNGSTVVSFATAILDHHFAKYGAMLKEMKTETYLAQP